MDRRERWNLDVGLVALMAGIASFYVASHVLHFNIISTALATIGFTVISASAAYAIAPSAVKRLLASFAGAALLGFAAAYGCPVNLTWPWVGITGLFGAIMGWWMSGWRRKTQFYAVCSLTMGTLLSFTTSATLFGLYCLSIAFKRFDGTVAMPEFAGIWILIVILLTPVMSSLMWWEFFHEQKPHTKGESD